ncbi:MAG: hypothetical protein HS111_16615 [Kofleriaceae bacterium]|nr:hypothetical protein [Kofleriaceae bacterium]MCL4228471.1 hypothetical protein [Myxococcales bacterium]
MPPEGARACAAVALAVVAAAAACGSRAPSRPPRPASVPEQVVYDFEAAVLDGRAAFEGLFDFVEVGAFEILLRRYDLLGRLPYLTDEERADLEADDGTPYPPERERRNVGNFYKRLAQRTVGTGGCAAAPPRWRYNQLLGVAFEPLPPGHEHYEALRLRVNAQLARGGGVIGIRCAGGKGGLALVYSQRDSARGYDIITIYDDGVP